MINAPCGSLLLFAMFALPELQIHLPTKLTCRGSRSDGAHQPFVLAPDPVDSGSWTERDLLFMHVGGPSWGCPNRPSRGN
jgi:hypothetical protein